VEYRALGTTGWKVSAISFGAWAIGGTWGEVDDAESLDALNAAVDNGVNFFDTADVYGDGHSERLIAKLKRSRSETIYVATKAGRRLDPHISSGYTRANLKDFIDRSRRNLEMETLDLVQLHCPPSPVYYTPEVFEALEEFRHEGRISQWGVSVEKIEEGLKAMEYPGCRTVQIIYNIFRQRPQVLFLREAMARGIGVLARLPLSSGMLTGKLTADNVFAPDDHRGFNREGAAFDKGETFSGLPYEAGLAAVEHIRHLVPQGMTMSQMALRWIIDHPAVTCAIPGGRNRTQVDANCAAADLSPLSHELHKELAANYLADAAPFVHQRW
jgi:aryl-alcohol dehydrogenase-like predicted oxidoreductase